MSVTISESINQVNISDDQNQTVEVITAGPQGPGINLDDSAKINRSIVYYDSTSAKFIADSTWTTSTLTDGGNF